MKVAKRTNHSPVARRTIVAALILLCAGYWANDVRQDTQRSIEPAVNATAAHSASDLRLQVHGDALILHARNVSIQEILDALVAQCDLKLIQTNRLDSVVSLDISMEPLATVLGRLLADFSFQLYERPSTAFGRPAKVLWIFDEGVEIAAAAADYLEVELLDGDPRSRREAVNGLRELASPEAVAALSVALADDDRKIRVQAIHALASIGGEQALVTLASVAADEDSWIRAEAVHALALIGGESAGQYLNLAMQDGDSSVRAAVIQAYADSGGEFAAQALSLALQDPDPNVRLEAVEALEEIGDDAAIVALLQARLDQDEAIREAASESLEYIGNRD